MQWFFLLDSGSLAQDLACTQIYFEQLDLKSLDFGAVGFIANDTSRGRSCLVKIAGALELPIVYNKFLPVYPACLVLPEGLPEILPGHRVWLIAGRGIGSKNEFKLLADMAQQCYAELGATRAIVDCGWADEKHQIGQGGLMPMADFAITIGVSGAVQHVDGLRKIDKIIAVNSDVNAEIFRVADYGIVASWQEFKINLLGLFNKNYKGDCYVDWNPKGNQSS